MTSQRNGLPWILVLLGFVALVLAPAHLRAQPASGESEQPVVQTALDYAAVDSASVANGLKLVLSNLDFTRNETSLAFELNVGNLWSSASVSDLGNIDSRGWRNPRSVTIVGSASQLVDAGDHTDEIDEWSLGLKWAIYDTTNLFRPETAEALVRTAADRVQKKKADYKERAGDDRMAFRQRIRADIEETYNQLYESNIQVASTVNSNRKKAMDKALEAARKNSNDDCRRDDIVNADWYLECVRKVVVDAMIQQVMKVVGNADCSIEAPFDKDNFLQLADAIDWFNWAWKENCRQTENTVEAGMAHWDAQRKIDGKQIATDANTIKDRAKGGWSVSLEARWMGDTEVLADEEGGGNADTVMLTREHAGFFGIDVSRRWRWRDKYFWLATLSPEGTLREDGALSVTIGGTLSMSSSPVGWAGDKGLVAAVAVNWRRERDENDQLEKPWRIEPQVAFPLDEKVFLQFNIRGATADGKKWDFRPTMTLAWTYENDDTGKSGTSMIQH